MPEENDIDKWLTQGYIEWADINKEDVELYLSAQFEILSKEE